MPEKVTAERGMIEDSSDEEAPFIGEKKASDFVHKKIRGTLFKAVLPWLLVLLLSFYVLLTTTRTIIVSRGSRSETHLWTSTDFERSTTQFTSSLEFLDPKNIYRVSDPSTPIYVGNATDSDEIDQNWDNLILPADIYISDDEAASLPLGVKLYRSPETNKFSIELEVFHSLHCLNMIRMAVYRDSYSAMQTSNAQVHVAHCIESLRELIMCEGNMTPIPIEWSEKGERINPNYAQRHSCRDFGALKEWTKRRAEQNHY